MRTPPFAKKLTSPGSAAAAEPASDAESFRCCEPAPLPSASSPASASTRDEVRDKEIKYPSTRKRSKKKEGSETTDKSSLFVLVYETHPCCVQ